MYTYTFIYRQYIPGIYQVYTKVNSIYHVYTRYRPTSKYIPYPYIYLIYRWYISGISLVYIVVLTWYIPGIYRLYVNLGDIAGIYHTKTSMHLFGTSRVPPSTGHIPGISLIYPGIWPVEGGTWLVPNKCIEVCVWYIPAISPMLTYRRYISGLYQVYTNVGDIHGIYQGYTLYILGIYHGCHTGTVTCVVGLEKKQF